MVNRQVLIGRLGGDATLRHTASGAAVASFSVATWESWTDKGGERKERTTWHRALIWGAIAETLKPKLLKGVMVYLDGLTQHREYQAQDGTTKRVTEVKVDRLFLLHGGKARDDGKGYEGEDLRGGRYPGEPDHGGPEGKENELPF